MLTRSLVIVCVSTCLLAGEAAGTKAEPSRGLVPGRGDVSSTTSTPPWKQSFVTQVRGKDRQFVTFQDRTYILVAAEELASGLGDGQEVALTGKLRKLPGGRFGLYRIDNLVIETVGESLAGKLDGDNVHLLGTVTAKAGGRSMAIQFAAIAPSDAQLLHERLVGIADDDWDRRLGVVSWCRDQARVAGNADFWSTTADSLMTVVVEDLGRKAAERKDLALVLRALDLALNQLRDQGLAARVASPLWIREHGGSQADIVARRMRGLNFALYKDVWMPRAQALEREYTDRFAELAWKDADGFYRLGRWADENAEVLPQARERSWRCYQAGFNADPSHTGIARELGVQPQSRGVAGVVAGNAPATDFIDLESGLRVPAPPGWRRGAPIGGATTWTDPNSETSYVTVRVVRPPVDEEAQWKVLVEEARARTGYVEIGFADQDVNQHRTRTLRYAWTEGSQQRFSAVMLVVLGDEAPAAILEARGAPAEQSSLDGALAHCAAGTARQTP